MARPKHGDFRIVNKEGTNFYAVECFVVDNYFWWDRFFGKWRRCSTTYQDLEGTIDIAKKLQEEYQKDKRKREERLEYEKRPEHVVWTSYDSI